MMSPREEIIPYSVIRDMVAYAINHYHQENGHPPRQILYFRDSIGETRYPLLKRSEEYGIKASFKKCPCLSDASVPRPLIELVICAKRHPHKFDFTAIGGGQDGIVIDQDVVSSEYWQFMIQHCRGSQPTQYDVICDEWQVQHHVQKIQAFYESIHSLTFCYTIAKKGVKLPAQLMWAHHFSMWKNELFQRWVTSLHDLVSPERVFRPKMYIGDRVEDSYEPDDQVWLFDYPEEKPKRRGRGGPNKRGGYRSGGGRGGNRMGGRNDRGRGKKQRPGKEQRYRHNNRNNYHGNNRNSYDSRSGGGRFARQ